MFSSGVRVQASSRRELPGPRPGPWSGRLFTPRASVVHIRLISYRSPRRQAMMGCTIPCSRMEAASSVQRFLTETQAGLLRIGIQQIDVDGQGVPSVSTDGSRASMPLPSTRLFIFQYFLCQRDIALAPREPGVVQDDQLPEAGGFGQAHVSGNDGQEDLIPKKLSRSFRTCVDRLVRSSNIVSNMPSMDNWGLKLLRTRISVSPSSVTPSECKILALDGDQYRIRRHQTGDCQRI